MTYNFFYHAMNFLAKERQRHHISVGFALEGIKVAFLTQPNFVYHAFFSALALILGLVLQIGYFQWLVLVFTVIVGFVVEMANTAIESVVDLATDKWHKDAKRAKDIAAGMMLLYAYGAVIIAIMIFTPYFFRLLNFRF